jgi:hypothetical protein
MEICTPFYKKAAFREKVFFSKQEFLETLKVIKREMKSKFK